MKKCEKCSKLANASFKTNTFSHLFTHFHNFLTLLHTFTYFYTFLHTFSHFFTLFTAVDSKWQILIENIEACIRLVMKMAVSCNLSTVKKCLIGILLRNRSHQAIDRLNLLKEFHFQKTLCIVII